MQKYSVLIPAAGLSGRMGQSKAFLPYPSAKSLADAIIQNYLNENCVKIVLVLNKQDYHHPDKFNFFPVHPKVHVLLNPNAKKGRFTSIQTGLLSLSSQYPVFLHNVDNPPTPSALISDMLENLEDHAFLIPNYKLTNGHPLLMRDQVMEAIKNANENANLRDILSAFEGKIMPCEFPEVLVNLNTPEEYERFLNLES
ncbi:MAG: NTP transferase domain-containing protein [Bacteroidales bacterium]|nr:NTP transferase domain-containing protein [Bacteroidales bacterium]